MVLFRVLYQAERTVISVWTASTGARVHLRTPGSRPSSMLAASAASAKSEPASVRGLSEKHLLSRRFPGSSAVLQGTSGFFHQEITAGNLDLLVNHHQRPLERTTHSCVWMPHSAHLSDHWCPGDRNLIARSRARREHMLRPAPVEARGEK
jgi:hypothetical protein